MLVMNGRPISLTGIKPTGEPHIGNFVGAIRPALKLAEEYDAYYFIADYHALTTVRDAGEMALQTRSVAATWLACGLDPSKVVFYRQSDVPETFELTWILSCLSPKGLVNRAHAYKAARDRNSEAGEGDLDAGVNMGLYGYPVLMAADILIMEADVVPVGKGQVQHVEMTRDMAEKFNLAFGGRYALKTPRHLYADSEASHTVTGLDGRKMSKSYGNVIPLFAEESRLKKLCRRITTDSTTLEDPKDPDTSSVFAIYQLFAGEAEQADMRERMLAGGTGWGTFKDELYGKLNEVLSGPRERYNELMNDPKAIEAVLAEGAEKAREHARRVLGRVREAVGIDL